MIAQSKKITNKINVEIARAKIKRVRWSSFFSGFIGAALIALYWNDKAILQIIIGIILIVISAVFLTVVGTVENNLMEGKELPTWMIDWLK